MEQAVAAPTWQAPLCLNGKGWYFHYVWDSVVHTSVNVTAGALLPREQLSSPACTFALIMQQKAEMLLVAPDDEQDLKPWLTGGFDSKYAKIFNLCYSAVFIVIFFLSPKKQDKIKRAKIVVHLFQ